MNIRDIESMKEKIVDIVGLWAEDRVSMIADNNPRLALASVYIKRGIKNYLHKKRDDISKAIDSASLFLCDESGEMNLKTFFNDLLGVFRDMEEIPFSLGLASGTIGRGVIRIEIPNGILSGFLFGELSCIKITEADIKELCDLMTSE